MPLLDRMRASGCQAAQCGRDAGGLNRSGADIDGRWGSTEATETIARFLRDDRGLPTPFLVVDLDLIEDRYQRLIDAVPASRVLFAVKANPAPEVLQRLADAGSSFDVASLGEIERCLELGIDPGRLAFGNKSRLRARRDRWDP